MSQIKEIINGLREDIQNHDRITVTIENGEEYRVGLARGRNSEEMSGVIARYEDVDGGFMLTELQCLKCVNHTKNKTYGVSVESNRST